jgi:N12 class adenine-specific DNA methylase
MGKKQNAPVDDDFLKSMVDQHFAEKKKTIPSGQKSASPGTASSSGSVEDDPDTPPAANPQAGSEADGKPVGLNSFKGGADLTNVTAPAIEAPAPLIGKAKEQYQQQQEEARKKQTDQLKTALAAYSANSGVPVQDLYSHDDKTETVKQYKAPTIGQSVSLGARYLMANVAKGIGESLVAPVEYLNNKVGLSDDKQTKKVLDNINEGKGTNLGLNNEFVEKGYDGGTLKGAVMNGLGFLAKNAAPTIMAGETGGASFALQGMGNAQLQIQKLKNQGVKFANHSDDLYTWGSGLINYFIGKSVAGAVLSKGAKGLANDVISNLSADALSKLADKGANLTTENIISAFHNEAMSFTNRLAQYGTGILKTYSHVGADLAAANVASFGLKAGVNKLNTAGKSDGSENPLGETTGDEFAKGLISPFYNGDNPHGDLKQALFNVLTSPAAGLSAVHAATSMGTLFDKTPRNAVIESLRQDSSPENIQRVKDFMAGQAQTKGWSEDNVANTNAAVDALADVAKAIPNHIPAKNFQSAVDLVLGRRQLEAVQQEVQSRKGNLDPAAAQRASAFETLLAAKTEQANDKIAELVSDKKFTYGQTDDGLFYKQMEGEQPYTITKERYDLENAENKSKPAGEKAQFIAGPDAVVEAGGKKVKLTGEDLDYLRKQDNKAVNTVLDQKEDNVTLNIKNNEVADNIISMLDERDTKEKEAAKGKSSAAKPGAPAAKPAAPKAEPVEPDDEDELDSFKQPESSKAADLNAGMGDMAKGMTGGLYDGLYKSLQDGKDTFAGLKDPVLAKSKAAYEAGLIKSPEDLQKYVTDGYPEVKENDSRAKSPNAAPPEKYVYSPNIVDGSKFYTHPSYNEGQSMYKVEDIGNSKFNIYPANRKGSNSIAINNRNEAILNLFDEGNAYNPHANNLFASKPAVIKVKDGRLVILEKGKLYYDKVEPKANEQAPVNTKTEASVPAKPATKPAETPAPADSEKAADPKHREKAIEAIKHGIIVGNEQPGDTSARFDFGMTTAEKKKAVSDIAKGRYDTAPAKRMIDTVAGWERDGAYPIIEGLGGGSVRSRYATPEEIQHHIDAAKSFTPDTKVAPADVQDINKGLKDLGISHEDILNYEQYRADTERADHDSRTTGSNEEGVQPAENDNAASVAQTGSDKTAQRKPVKAPARETKMPSVFDSAGDTEKNMTERGSKTPEIKFKKALTSYSKAIADELGYVHDTDKKGKAIYAHVNVPPAGGDGHFILWKPNSDYGVYVQFRVDTDLGNDTVGDFGNDKLTISNKDWFGGKDAVLWRVTTKGDKYRGLGNRYTTTDLTAAEFADKIKEAVDRESKNEQAPVTKTTESGTKSEKTATYESESDSKGTESDTNTTEEPKTEEQAKREKLKENLRKAKEEFLKTFNTLNAGVNPETIAKGLKMMAAYAELGLHDFGEIVKDLHEDLGDKLRDVFEGIKAAYGAFTTQEATDEQLDLMTDVRTVRKAKIEDYINDKQPNDENRSEPATLEENSPSVPERQSPGTSAESASNREAESVPGPKDDGSRETGNEPAATESADQQPANARPDNGSGAGARSRGKRSGAGEPDTRDAVPANTEKRELSPEDTNHQIKAADTLVPTGEVGKFNGNLNAIFQLMKLEKENRNPSPDEKRELAKFVGWGGLAKYLDISYGQQPIYDAVQAVLNGSYAMVPKPGSYYRTRVDFESNGPLDMTKYKDVSDLVDDLRKQLSAQGFPVTLDQLRAPLVKSLLTPEQYRDAINSTINAHYTDRRIIDKMWGIAQRLGFKGGKVLESSAGIGHFFGLLPESLRDKTLLSGYELDSVTGRMLAKLYPQANIQVKGFEHSRVPLNSIDLATGNVPFGTSAPYDKNFPELSKFSMHNYFIAKNLKLLKPGGTAILITSSSTMDSPASAKFREWVSAPDGGNSYLVGAIRLPNNAFSENAGTEVTTDMLIFQKRSQTTNPELEQPFRYVKNLKEGKDNLGKAVPIDVNEYFIQHPENMLGEMMTAHEAGSGGLHSSARPTLKAAEGTDLTKELDRVINDLPKDIAGGSAKSAPSIHSEDIAAVDKKEGSLFTRKGKVYRVLDGEGKAIALDEKKAALANAYTGMKSNLLDLIKLEQTTNAESNIEALRKELNKDYDAFVKKHGYLNGRGASFLEDLDIDYPIMASLENISRSLVNEKGRDKIVQEITKGEILKKRINFPRSEPTQAKDIADAINISLNYRTGIDLDYMSQMLGEPADDIRERLLNEELAFENPDSGLLETPEDYLSGYVRDKLRAADVAAQTDPKYNRNVEELKKIIPVDIPSSLISYSLGSSWIPSSVYQEFAKSAFDASLNISYLEAAGKYSTSVLSGHNNAKITNTYAAGGKSAIDLFDDTLNNRQTVVFDTIIDPETNNKKQVRNPEKTAAAQAMQQQMQDEFETWVRNNPEATALTERAYNDKFNGQVLRNYRIPDFKHFPGASTDISLRLHQKRAVSRGLAESTLFAHEVGSGKTFTIITTAMEMRRLGTARKPLIGVQNSTLGQFVASFKALYPGAKLLAPSAKEMEAEGRKRLFAKIATGDWDAIILPHSQISMIPDDPERQKAYIREQIEEMQAIQGEMDKRSPEFRQMESEIKKLMNEYTDLSVLGEDGAPKGKKGASAAKAQAKKALSIEASMEKALDRRVDNVLNFEQLGIDAILMDEAHRYKRLGFQTNMKNIKGIDTSKSQRSQSILLKTRWVQEKTAGKNVLFYTGTPISNTMAEAWTMMKYVRPDILEHLGIEYFDQFAKTFGQVIPSLEQTGGGTFKVQNRFAKFQNLPEFITAFRAATDVVLSDDVKEFQENNSLPKLKNGRFTQIVIPQSPELKSQIRQFRETLEAFEKMTGKEKREHSHIPLVIFNKAKQSSIDLRLLDPSNVDSPQSKVNEAVKNAVRIYKDTKGNKGVQMIFSDMYQSPEPKDQFLDEDRTIVNPAYGKPRFNLFNDIRDKLMAAGVPANEIVVFTEPKYDKAERKEQVFDDANNGKIRFLLGTTEKMGVGVNAQKKMVAIHHVDIPGRPLDVIQRNGRGVRQGNENKEIDVVFYGVEKTLDAAGFQRNSTKQHFINQVMKGQNLQRITEDPADEVQMTFDEMMAQLSDSPFAMQKLLVDNKLRSEKMKSENFRAKITTTTRDLRDAQGQLRSYQSQLSAQQAFAKLANDSFQDGNVTEMKIGQEVVTKGFGDAANSYIEKLIEKFNGSPTHYAKGGLFINGVRVELEIKDREVIDNKTHLVTHNPELHYTIPELGLTHNSFGFGIPILSNSGAGLMISLRSKLSDVVESPMITANRIKKLQADIAQLENDANAKFDDSKLKALEKESEELKAKMLADNNRPAEEPASVMETILDQTNIKPALDFLDSMKAKTNGRLMSSIVPIPPAVWNGAIEVMKNILKATNSTQKAIRIAAKYIVDKGGSAAQAMDFEQTIGEKMKSTKAGKKAISPDVEDDVAISDKDLLKVAADLQRKLIGVELPPAERDLANLELSDLKRRELNRYVELASVLSVDPEGVLTKDINTILNTVNNQRQPKTGTAVDTPDLPPRVRKTIARKEKIPMDAMEEPEQPEIAGTVKAKENYSIMGKIKDVRVRNLNQLSMFGNDTRNMEPLRAVRQFVTSKSQASVIMKTATDRIVKLVGKDGWNLLRQALVESRLRGIRDRWKTWSEQIMDSSDNEIDDLFENGKLSPLYGILDKLQGYDGDENPPETIAGMISNGEYDDAREYMSEMFDNAAHNVASYDKLANGKTFDEQVQDGKFVNPKMQEALEAYKTLLEKPLQESHASNDGVFSDSLGDLNTYYPLTYPEGEKQHYTPRGADYKAPANFNNKFATGQAEKYSSEIAGLSNALSSTIRSNNKAGAIKALENAGLLAKVTKDDPDTGTIEINGEVYTATKVPYEQARTVINPNEGSAVSLPTRYFMVPDWLHREIKPIFEKESRDEFSLFGKINNTLIKFMLGGPIEATSHSYRLLGGIVNSMPYMQEWAYKNGVLGHVGGLALNNPFVKTFVGMGKVLFTDISSEEALKEIQEMASIGVIPEKTWTKTWSREFAELTGGKALRFTIGEKINLPAIWDWSPILYGKNSVDLKARVMMYRLSKAMNPNATPEQMVKMQNELGNYTNALQGELEKFVKRHGIAPFYSFGGAIYRSGVKAVFGASSLPLDRPSLKEAFTSKVGAKAATKLLTYKMAQLVSAGVIGLAGYWAFIYHAQTNKWPWEDKSSKLLKLPFPEWAKNDQTAGMFLNKKTGVYDDIDMSFFNPFLNRGVRAVGAQKAYETTMLGGTPGQAVEAGSVQAINTNLSPYTSSPAIQIGVTALSGAAPYINSIRDDRGRPDIGLYRRVKTFSPGLQIPANVAVGAIGLNPLVDGAFSPLTKSLKFNYGSQEDMDAASIGKSVINTILPHILTPHGDDANKEKYLKRGNKAIQTTMKKEGKASGEKQAQRRLNF